MTDLSMKIRKQKISEKKTHTHTHTQKENIAIVNHATKKLIMKINTRYNKTTTTKREREHFINNKICTQINCKTKRRENNEKKPLSY